MLIYFAIYCFLGYLMESLYVSFLQRKWISSGLLKGPFIPLYGIGACLLIVLRRFLTYHILIAIIGGGILLTSLEYLASIFIERYFHTRCWNYSHHRFHFQGRICLSYFFVWSFLSYVFLYHIHPFISSLSLINDTSCILSMIYLAFLFKALFKKTQAKKDGLDIH